ncbi:MAG: hypothetical protein AAGE94_01045 [Acidobacteriota bacterium]
MSEPAPSRRAVEVVARVALVVGFLALIGVTAPPAPRADDAFITFRYAENWAAGHGVVFDVGERVEGYSNFLFLALLAIGVRCGLSVIAVANAINLIAALVIAWLIVGALPGRRRRSSARWWAAALVLGSGHMLLNVTSGLEAPLTAALVLAAALASEHRRPIVTPLCCLALALNRPEGIALAAVVMVVDGVREWVGGDATTRRRALLGWCWGLALPYAVYLAWRVAYFGQLLPNSIVAKMGQPAGASLRGSLDYMAPAAVTYWPLLALVATAGAFALRQWLAEGFAEGFAAGGRLWTVWSLVGALVVLNVATGSGDPYVTFLRYLLPLLPLLAALGVDAFEQARVANRGRVVLQALVVVFALGQLALSTERPRLDRSVGPRIVEGFGDLFGPPTGPPETSEGPGLYAVAAWMREHLDPDALLVTAEVGIVPYYTGMRVIDTFGLVDPEIAEQAGRPGAKARPNQIFDQDPDVFVVKKATYCLCGGIPSDVEIFRDPRFRRGYELVHVVPEGARSILVFARRATVDPSPVVHDLCAVHDGERVVLRTAEGEAIDDPPGWLGRVVRRRTSRLADPVRRQELFDRLQPVVLGEVAVDSKAAAWMREWQARSVCYLRQLPVVPSRHDLSVRHAVDVPAGASLRFAFGVPFDSRNHLADAVPVVFRIETVAVDGVVREIFSRSVLPSESSIWQDAVVDLGAFVGETIELRLRVEQPDGDPKASSPSVHNAGWRGPVVVVPEPMTTDPISDREMP